MVIEFKYQPNSNIEPVSIITQIFSVERARSAEDDQPYVLLDTQDWLIYLNVDSTEVQDEIYRDLRITFTSDALIVLEKFKSDHNISSVEIYGRYD